MDAAALAIFADVCKDMKVVELDDAEMAAEYAMSLQERVTIIKDATSSKTAMTNEVLTSLNAKDRTTSLVYQEFEEIMSVQNMLDAPHLKRTVVFANEEFIVPAYKKPVHAKAWLSTLQSHLARLENLCNELDQLRGDCTFRMEMNALKDMVNKMQIVTKDKTVQQTIVLTIYGVLLERIVRREAGSIALELGPLPGYSDQPTNGVWVEKTPTQTATKLLERIGTRRIVLTCNYKLNANQTEHLVKLAFSSDPGVRAGARLDLSAKLDRRLFEEINDSVGTALDVVFSEALLSQIEILYAVFPTLGKSGQHICLACNTEVKMGTFVYHQKCATVQWLLQYGRFSYDMQTSLIEPKDMVFIAPEAKARLIKILRYHAQMSVDIVHRTSEKVVYYARQDDGSLRATPVESTPREDIPGTHQWMISHGYKLRDT